MQQKLLTSPPWDWWWKTLHTQVQECLPMCRPLTSQSVCDTWTHSPVQRSPRITCGLLTVRAKSLNPAGETVSEYASFIGSSLHILYVGVSHGELSIFQCGFQAIYSFCILSTVLPLLSLSLPYAVCSSVEHHSLLERDQEYLLLEECESKTVPPQASLWVASQSSWNCLLVWSVAHA